jgi:hypothetical protein
MALIATGAGAQQASLKEQIVGTWMTASWEQTMPDGSKLHRFGADPKGMNVFMPDGRFMVMFARPDLPRISSNDPMKPTPQEAEAILTGSIAYFGTYTVDEQARTISMRVEASTLPNQLGTPSQRKITALSANDLRYENPTPMAGGRIEVAFKRAPAAATTGSGAMGRPN